MHVGDRVIATRDIDGAFFVAVPKGTRGVVTRVGFFGGMTVDFENGKSVEAGEDAVARINR